MSFSRNVSDPIIIPPNENHTHTVVLLHGHGQSAHDMLNVIFGLRTDEGESLPSLFPHTRWVFPQAPEYSDVVTGRGKSSWLGRVEDGPYAKGEHAPKVNANATSHLTYLMIRLLRHEVEVLNSKTENLVIAGFDQGMAIGMLSAMLYTTSETRFPDSPRFGGFVGISGFFPRAELAVAFLNAFQEPGYCWVSEEHADERMDEAAARVYHMLTEPFRNILAPRDCQPVSKTFARTPALIMHAWNDRYIPMQFGDDAWVSLGGLGMWVSSFEFTGTNDNGHEFNAEALGCFAEFMKSVQSLDPSNPQPHPDRRFFLPWVYFDS